MHCTIWSEGVREIVSAADSDVKCIISDHPVTIYNHAMPPESEGCEYPLDPSIALKASQTIYPLDRDYCLMRDAFDYLAELEYRGTKPNWEASLAARMGRLHRDSQKRLNKAAASFSSGRIHGLFPVGGIQDNTVNPS